MDKKLHIGHGFNKIRRQKNLTFKQIAQRLGYNQPPAAANIVRRAITKTDMIDKLAEALEVTHQELVEACLVDKEKDQ